MAREWIEELAAEIKGNGREAAETYDRQQHRAALIGAEGKIFFTSLLMCLEEDLSELRRYLQGSATACETTIQTDGLVRARLYRDRFPWFDAVLQHREEDILLEYAGGRGVPGDRAKIGEPERRSAHFVLTVDSQEKVTVCESFGETPKGFETPGELSRHILELLFRF